MKKQLAYNEKERTQMAEAYLIFGTFRRAEDQTGWSKTTIHKVVSEFVSNGGFDDVDALSKLVETNKKERAIRGGMATAKRWEKMKK